MLLNSQSCTDTFCNAVYLNTMTTTVRPTIINCYVRLTMCTKGGVFTMDKFGNIPVKYNPQWVMQHDLTQDNDNAFPHVTQKQWDGCIQGACEEWDHCKPCAKGLHYFDFSKTRKANMMCIQTGHQNFKGFTRRQVLGPSKQRNSKPRWEVPSRLTWKAW